MDGQFELRLLDSAMPAGEIDLRDLADLSGRLQELATRVGRWVAGIDRRGRSTSDVEEAVVLRLSGISRGSTVLEISRGPSAVLDFSTPLEQEFDDRFWETIAAIAHDSPRTDTPIAVRETVVALLDAMNHAAGQVEFRRQDNAQVTFRPSERDRKVWAVPAKVADDQEITLSGVVKAVDLATHKFRLHDDVGNRIPLEGIDDADVARELLDRRANAVGLPVRDARGRLSALRVSSIAVAHVPAEWTRRVHDESWRTADVPGPDPDGGIEFTDEEWNSFMAAIGGE